MGNNCGDDPRNVEKNRQLLRTLLPTEPRWLKQVHGTQVIDLSKCSSPDPVADAVVGALKGQVCAILHADCLPVLFCNQAGTKVAAIHVGWRGLLAGVLEAAISIMACKPAKLMVWLGPAIGPQAFEVGQEIYDDFVGVDAGNAIAFKRCGDRWLADLYRLVRLALLKTGTEQVSGGQYCTYTEKDKFFSYRRDGTTGRMATMIWLAE